MDTIDAPTQERAAGPSTTPPSRQPETDGHDPDAVVAPAVLASLQLAAALLDQYGDADAIDCPLVDVVLGGYRWTVTRCAPVPADVRQHSAEIQRLSPREREVVRMVAQGLTNRAIASALDISPWTVGTHLRRIFGKLEVNSRAAMVALAIENGLRPEVRAPGDASERPSFVRRAEV